MEPISAVFGRRLRSIRKARGLTQEELGRAAGVDFKHVGNLERGIHPPSFAAVERLARVLKVDYFELFVPEGMSTLELDQQVRALVPDVQKVEPDALRQFFTDLSHAIRKLQHRGRR